MFAKLSHRLGDVFNMLQQELGVEVVQSVSFGPSEPHAVHEGSRFLVSQVRRTQLAVHFSDYERFEDTFKLKKGATHLATRTLTD